MFLHKRFVAIGVSLVLLSSVVVLPTSVNAESNANNSKDIISSVPKQITSLNQLEDTLKSVTNSKSYKQLDENQKKAVTEGIKANITQNVYDILTGKVIKALHANKKEFTSDTGNDEQIINVDSNTQIVVDTKDTAENNDSGMITPFNMPEMYNVTKDYGDREYEIHASYNIQGIGLLDERLTMHYSLGSYGIKMRYASIAGSYAIGANMDATPHVTDSVATHEGADVNAYADFKVSFLMSIGGTRFDRVHGKVQLYKWYKSSHKMYLRESWYSE